MNLIDVTGQTKVTATTDKEIGSLAFFFDEYFDNLTNEKISLRVERNGQNNIPITSTPVSLKMFLMVASYGRQAIASFQANHYEPFKTAVLALLTIDGNVELAGNDKIIIELTDLDPALRYVVDGITHEDTNPDDSLIVTYEEKIIAEQYKNSDINVDDYFHGVIEDKQAVSEFNFTYAKSKQVVKLTPREFRMLSVDADPIAYVRQNGQVFPSYKDFIQMNCEDLLNLNIVKQAGTQITALFSKNVRMAQLGLIK